MSLQEVTWASGTWTDTHLSASHMLSVPVCQFLPFLQKVQGPSEVPSANEVMTGHVLQ